MGCPVIRRFGLKSYSTSFLHYNSSPSSMALARLSAANCSLEVFGTNEGRLLIDSFMAHCGPLQSGLTKKIPLPTTLRLLAFHLLHLLPLVCGDLARGLGQSMGTMRASKQSWIFLVQKTKIHVLRIAMFSRGMAMLARTLQLLFLEILLLALLLH